jgi:eukaryotic-like serine/threonine-protein kinase
MRSGITPAASGPDKLAGTHVGHYTIVSKLGCGGQGVVYLAHDTTMDRPVALKFLPPALADDECMRQRFAREALTAAAVQHPNVCAIYAIEATDEGQPFIAMAYCEGMTLRRALNDGVLTIADAIDVAAQIAEGLSAAHAHGVIHRDVKPGNVMLTDLGVKVIDFGLARFMDSSQITAVGSVLGTASYMSPEQIRCQPADSRSDVWSLGIILYEMLTGAPPFSGSHPDAICHAIKHDSIRPSTMGVPMALRSLVFRALSKNPARRPSASALARGLRGLQLSSQVLSTKLSTLAQSANECRPDARRSLGAALTPAYSALVTAADIIAAHVLKGSAPRIRALQ